VNGRAAARWRWNQLDGVDGLDVFNLGEVVPDSDGVVETNVGVDFSRRIVDVLGDAHLLKMHNVE
jgi:hypothetical protein